MNSPLSYRIMTLPLATAPLQPCIGVDQRLQDERETIKACPKIDMSNVAAFLAEHDRDLWDSQEDIPNWAPPFAEFFCEFEVPGVWRKDGVATVESDNPGQHGALILAMQDPSEKTVQQFLRVLAGTADDSGFAPWSRLFPETAFLLGMSHWHTIPQLPICGRPVFDGIETFVFVSKSGRCLDVVHAGAGMADKITVAGEDHVNSAYTTMAQIIGLGISFMHCKNVVQKECVFECPPRVAKSGRVPSRIVRKTLEIDGLRAMLNSEGRLEENGIKKAMHICRGHFAHYSEEAPLFGKYTGDFWRPDHVRGSSSLGRIIKGYRVHPPKAGEGQ